MKQEVYIKVPVSGYDAGDNEVLLMDEKDLFVFVDTEEVFSLKPATMHCFTDEELAERDRRIERKGFISGYDQARIRFR